MWFVVEHSPNMCKVLGSSCRTNNNNICWTLLCLMPTQSSNNKPISPAGRTIKHPRMLSILNIFLCRIFKGRGSGRQSWFSPAAEGAISGTCLSSWGRERATRLESMSGLCLHSVFFPVPSQSSLPCTDRHTRLKAQHTQGRHAIYESHGLDSMADTKEQRVSGKEKPVPVRPTNSSTHRIPPRHPANLPISSHLPLPLHTL